ncbi:glycosyl hydrolase family 61-domain-containing protein [Trametes polyzona]|nr:glycosyl hydrolase family 61-domain-containing protein [Trametes polyzona]
MKAATTLALSLLAVVPFVSAHGYVSEVTIDGKSYKGNSPNSNSVKSPIRMIDDVSPVKGASNKYLSCGQNAQKAATVASANPGSKVSFQWVNGNGGNWPHNVGPMLTYMASCGSTGCKNFDSSNARWFKIAQVGQESDGTWAQAAMMNGEASSVTLPSNIAPGEYLLRHEIIALHTAMSEGGAEFYPSCTQIKVGGNGKGYPSSTVSLPGAYKDTDAGLLVDVYDMTSKYVFPGPAISNLAGKTAFASNGTSTDDSDDSDDSETSSASETASSTATATESASASSTATSATASASTTADAEEGCDEEEAAEDYEESQLPRRFSRVMRAIL